MKFEWKTYEHEKGFLTHTLQVNYGLKDAKGREVGCTIHIRENDDVWKDGVKFPSVVSGRIQSSRDGVCYGAHNGRKQVYLSVDAAKVDMLDRARDALAKCYKKATKTGGVHLTGRQKRLNPLE